MATKIDSRRHEDATQALEAEFARMGTPRKIVCDREFISDHIKIFALKKEIEICPITRESPWLNMVERYHAEIKAIATKSDKSIQDSINILNNLPFSKTPQGSIFKKISPAELFFKNDTKILKEVCKFLKASSISRNLRGKELRGINITRFERKFQIGDIVRFNMGKHNIGFGKIKEKTSSKTYEVERIDGSGSTAIHAQQLQLVTISEEFLKILLNLK